MVSSFLDGIVDDRLPKPLWTDGLGPHDRSHFSRRRVPPARSRSVLVCISAARRPRGGAHSALAGLRAVRAGFRASYKAQKGYYVEHGEDREKVAFYLCEQNAIRESRKGKGRTPGDLLHNIAATGDADDLGLLLGFHEAVAGKRKLSTSRGFWDL